MNIQDKAPFLSGVFGHLIFQMFIMFRALEATVNNASFNEFAANNNLILTLGNLGLFMALIFIKMGLPYKLTLFTLMSFTTGMLMHKIKDMKEALLETIAIFIAMLFAGIATVKLGYDLSTLGIVLIFSLIALIFARLLSPGKKKYTKIATLIFALFIVYDTNKILQRNYGGDFVNASLDYFTDIINLLSITSEEA
jgi:FtsH-binding integral membrane protein